MHALVYTESCWTHCALALSFFSFNLTSHCRHCSISMSDHRRFVTLWIWFLLISLHYVNLGARDLCTHSFTLSLFIILLMVITLICFCFDLALLLLLLFENICLLIHLNRTSITCAPSFISNWWCVRNCPLWNSFLVASHHWGMNKNK